MTSMKWFVLVLAMTVPMVSDAAQIPALQSRVSQQQSVQPPAQETQQQPFSITKGAPFKLKIGVTTPGPVYIDLSWRGVPLEVKLQSEVTQQVLAVQRGNAPALRLIYMVTAADVQRGYYAVATVYVPAGYNVEESKTALAQGAIRAVYPKPDQRLLASVPATGAVQPLAVPQLKAQPRVTERFQHVPLRYVTPRLAQLTTTKVLSKTPVALNQRIIPEGRQPIPFRPFTMEEVFDLQTGKPLFARNIDERTGELILPQQLRTNVTVGRQLGAQELQQKGFNAVQLKAPGAVRFGKISAGPLTVKSKISIPRRDGLVSEAEVEDYLRELNDFEMQLNAVGQTLRDPQTGKIKTQAGVTTIGKLQRNEALLQQQLQKTRHLLDTRTVYRPWSTVEIKGMEQKAIATTPKRLLAPRNTWKDLPPGLLKVPAGVRLSPAATVIGGKGAGSVNNYPDCYLMGVTPDKGFAGMEVELNGQKLDGCQITFKHSANAMSVPVAVTPVDSTRLKVKIPALSDGQVKISAKRPSALQQQAATGTVMAAGGAAQHALGGTSADQHTLPFEIIRNVYAQTAPGQQAGSEPPPDYFSKDLQPFRRALAWGETYGDPANFAVGLKTEFAIYSDGGADDNLVRFKGYGGALGTLFNNEVEIIAAKGDVSIPTGNTKNDNDLRANFRITAGGFDVYKWGKQKNQQTGTEQGECAAEDKDSSGKCCNQKDSSGKCSDDGYVVQVRFEYKKHYQLAKVDYSTETNFTLGPVPMVARFGFRGEAGADLHAVVSPLQVIGKVTPYIKTSVYGECGVDLWFAEGGVGVNMTMLNMTVDAAGQAYLNFGTLHFDVDAYVYLTYDALSGYVYAYVDAFGNRWKWDIANWTGFKGNIYLLPVQKLSFPLFPGA